MIYIDCCWCCFGLLALWYLRALSGFAAYDVLGWVVLFTCVVRVCGGWFDTLASAGG